MKISLNLNRFAIHLRHRISGQIDWAGSRPGLDDQIAAFAQLKPIRRMVAYLEPELATILTRNKRRENPVPEKVILDLSGKAEPPTVTECHRLAYFGSEC